MKTIIAIAIAATAFAASTVNAQSNDTVSVRVSYADLNLSSASGRTTLDSRISAAAHAVCENGSTDLSAKMAANRCIKNALSGARLQVAAASPTAIVIASR